MEPEQTKTKNSDVISDEEYMKIPMFEEFEGGNEFPPSMNDLFGVMS